MRSLILLFASLCLATSAYAQETPRDAVDNLFDAMRAGNGDAILDNVAVDAPLMRIEAGGNVRSSSFEEWASWVDVQNEDDADEEIFDVAVHEHGGMASVWAPFILRYKGDIAGCGVNQFTLAYAAEKWTIVHGIDIADDGDCETFKARYRAKN